MCVPADTLCDFARACGRMRSARTAGERVEYPILAIDRAAPGAQTRQERSSRFHPGEVPMDPIRFDDLARSLTSGPSRRRVVAAMGSGLIAIFGGLREPAAGKQKRKKKCKPACGPCAACVKGKCKALADGAACPSGSCRGGACVADTGCPVGRHLCPFDDTGLCRECCKNADCRGSNMICDFTAQGSTCRCPNNQQECNGDGVCWSCCSDQQCTVYGRNPADGFICTVDHACVCKGGTVECGKASGFGFYCANIVEDPQDCGACGIHCPVCREGMCQDA